MKIEVGVTHGGEILKGEFSMAKLTDSQLQNHISNSESLQECGLAIYSIGISSIIFAGLHSSQGPEVDGFLILFATGIMLWGSRFYSDGSELLEKGVSEAINRGLLIKKKFLKRKLKEISDAGLELYLLPRPE